jgi:hypothetical protein
MFCNFHREFAGAPAGSFMLDIDASANIVSFLGVIEIKSSINKYHIHM